MKSMNWTKNYPLIAGIVVLVIVTLIMLFLVLSTEYKTLAQDLALEDSASIVNQLTEQNVEYQLTNGGHEIKVASGDLDTALIKLAENNSITNSKGLELYENADYSMTEHAQQVTYKRAMQGELERTIGQIEGIENVRVHLTFVKQKMFSSESHFAKASIMVELAQGYQVMPEWITGIQSLVASSVENLPIDNVTVLSASGVILDSKSISHHTINEKTSLNDELETNIEKILKLYFDSQQFAISVNIISNQNKRKEVIHSLLTNSDGKGALVKEKQKTSQVGTDSKDEFNSLNNNIDEQIEYEYAHGKKLEEITYDGNYVERINIAVAVMAEVSAEQAIKLKSLISAAAGISAERNDVLSFEVIQPIIRIEPTKVLLPKTSNLLIDKPVDVVAIDVEEVGSQVSFLNQYYVLYVGILFTFLTVIFFIIKRRRISSQEKENLLLEVNDWLSVKEAEHAK